MNSLALSQFEDHAQSCSQLWENSSAYEAISLAERIALWMRHFQLEKSDQFRLTLIHHCDKLVGGFAFYLDNEVAFRVAKLSANDWVGCGELFVDLSQDENKLKNAA